MDPSNLALLQGTLSSDPVQRELASGTRLVSLNLTTTHADGARSVPLVWFDPSPSVLTRLHSGVAVIVAGHVKRRFFRTAGTTQSRTEVVVERLAVAARPRDADRLAAAVRDALDNGWVCSPPVASVETR